MRFIDDTGNVNGPSHASHIDDRQFRLLAINLDNTSRNAQAHCSPQAVFESARAAATMACPSANPPSFEGTCL
jgi:hypothetical protein